MALQHYSHTHFQVSTVRYKWTIGNFSHHSQSFGGCIDSPCFYSDNNHEQAWKLNLYPAGANHHDRDFIGLFLEAVGSLKTPLRVTFELSIMNLETDEKYFKIALSHEFRQHQRACKGSTKFCPRDDIIDRTKGLLVGDTLTICCELKATSSTEAGKSYNITKATTPLQAAADRHWLSDELGLFLTAGVHSDLTIIAGDKKFPVHKAVLASRSPVFSAMFSNPSMIENQKKELIIHDITPETVEVMLRHIYTDKIGDKDKESVLPLLAASEKYQLNGLKARCELLCFKKLNIENSAEILILADMYNAKNLKKAVIDFICDHPNEFTQSTNYGELKKRYLHLMGEVLEEQLTRLSGVNNLTSEAAPVEK